ncbi:hypothetical protein RSW15_25115, partial [Escherichia coli]|uniref:hypothetical protein n=1 Tax=Escherichia coli TaxID=562 RepID=UPI0028DFC129
GSFQPNLDIPLNGVHIELAYSKSLREDRPVQLSELGDSDMLLNEEFLATYRKLHYDERI